MMINLKQVMCSLFFLNPVVLFAESPEAILQVYQNEAKKIPGFKGFSAEQGKRFYNSEQTAKNGLVSCSSCHTKDPKSVGKTRAQKIIEAMAPAVNAKRFTDAAKVEKWFTRNCDDVLKRPCTAAEKGDFITYLLSIK